MASAIKILQQLGFNATSWQSGSAQLTVLNLFATVWSQLSTTIATFTAGGFTTYPTGTFQTSNFLSLLAQYVYNTLRLPAQNTIGQVLLTSSAGAGTNTFAAGDLIVADQPNGTSNANQYTNTSGGSLGPSATLSLQFQALVAGAAANIAPNTTLYLWTPIAGVTPTNPPLSPSNTWITTPGADPESDARLAARCVGQWSQLTYGNTDGAYVAWALSALPALTRVAMQSAPGNGTVTLIGATALGGLTAGQITTIQNYVQGVSDGVGRRPINDIFTAVSATTVTTPAITVTVYAVSSVATTIASSVNAALLGYFGSLPLGGTVLSGTQGIVQLSVMNTTCMALTGVRGVDFNVTADIELSSGQIYLPTITVNVVTVAPGS